jgi:peptidyl-prolyl cis-trans isomerase D
MRSSAKYIWIFLVVAFVGGFLLAETSGLLGTARVTTSTAVATVNGEDILATTWFNATAQLEQQATQQSGRSVSLDERRHLSDQAFEQLVSDALLRQEYRRRGIRVTDDELAEAAKYAPPAIPPPTTTTSTPATINAFLFIIVSVLVTSVLLR